MPSEAMVHRLFLATDSSNLVIDLSYSKTLDSAFQLQNIFNKFTKMRKMVAKKVEKEDNSRPILEWKLLLHLLDSTYRRHKSIFFIFYSGMTY